jgi:cell division protein FtsW
LLPGVAILGAVCGIILVEDLGTAVLIGAVGVILLLAAGARWWHVALMIPPAAAAIVLSVAHSPYRLRRLTAFLDPWADPEGVGYHPIQSLLAIAGGQLTGRGLGNGIQKFGYLPEDTTDFLFAVICEELGVAGAGAVVGLYLALLWVGLGVVRESRHAFCRLVGLGVLATIGIQAAMNIAVVTVVVPTKGIALPLLSNGGTGWVMCGAAIGLLAAIDRLNQLEQDQQAEAQAVADQLREQTQVPFTSVSASQYPA